MNAGSRGSAAGVALAGLLSLAVAMGIGRFAFTPMLPVMQADHELTVESGGWLASVNYAGYLIGALAATRLAIAPLRAIALGLAAIVVTTLAMGLTTSFAAWAVLRTVAGVASAFVLVHVSSWAVARLALMQRSALSGVVFAGVGAGIALAGLLCLVFAAHGASAAQLWLVLGAATVVLVALAAPLLRASAALPGLGADASRPSERAHFGADAWLLIVCYGLYGFGYIIPATFLPVMARAALPDPALFGWAWPLVGVAVVASTLLGARAGHPDRARTHWALSHFVLAAGCAIPAAWPTFTAVLLSALCVGGTFVAITMFAVQEARNTRGEHARPLIGAMTAAFALGQIVGPLFVRKAEGGASPFATLLYVAAVLLVATGALLLRRPRAVRA